jgi:hypothetical protein
MGLATEKKGRALILKIENYENSNFAQASIYKNLFLFLLKNVPRKNKINNKGHSITDNHLFISYRLYTIYCFDASASRPSNIFVTQPSSQQEVFKPKIY